MGDQLISVDHLLSTISLINGHGIAERRVNPKSIERSSHLIPLLKEGEDWFNVLFRSYALKSSEHLFDESAKDCLDGIPSRLDPPVVLRGNHHVWNICKILYKRAKGGIRHDLTKRNKLRIKSSAHSAVARLSVSVSRSESSKFIESMNTNSSLIASLTTIETLLWETHQIRSKEFNRSCKSKSDPRILHSSHVPLGWLNLLIFSDLVFVKVFNYECIITKVHFERIAKMLRTICTFLLSEQDWQLKGSITDFLDEFFDLSEELINDNPDFIGEVIKGSRGILISQLDKSEIMGVNASEAYKKELNPERRFWSMEYVKLIKKHSLTPTFSVNLANVFKIVPHPDANMEKLFRTVEGVKAPNEIESKHIKKFEGTLRRMVYTSLTAQKYDVRLRAGSELGEDAERATKTTKTYSSKLKMMNAQTWACTEFEKVRGLVSINDIEVKPSSKSSQAYYPFTRSDLDEAGRYMAGLDTDYNDFLQNARTVNDVVTESTGSSNLHSERAIKRFLKVVELHEEFESRYRHVPIDDIPSRALEDFILENEDARYLVGTEPKFGEVHKQVTRMFYMAQQELKSITQRVERYTKQVCRKQPGVSITKSYPARRKDLESFCRNMVGEGDERQSIFVSFDMSEFSKKFPMELVRVFGKILSEISGEDWLKRIDLVFRASVVIHNSRGYFAHLAGVRGGFEGFFNFVWSSIHATIMEMALKSTGLQGEILVFSDDGLLMFYAPATWSKSSIQLKISAIQRIYRMFGLSFNLGKTLVSNHVWEYLGDICLDNHLVPMWIKELTSITRNIKNRGIEPFYAKIKAMQAQVDATVSAGFDPLIGFYIKRYFFGLMLDRLGIAYNQRLEELLSIVPTSCGGLRISSPFEMSCLNSLEKDSEFVADLILLSTYDRNLANVIMSSIKLSMNKRKDVIKMVVSGSRLCTHHPDTSGMGVINECVDLISVSPKVKVTVKKNPFSGNFTTELMKLLKTLNNVNLKVINDFIYSTPAWNEYTNSMALVRSSGILRLLSRGTISQLQHKDTLRVITSVDMWRDSLFDEGFNYRFSSPSEFLDEIGGKLMKGIDLAPLKPSPRICLVKVQKRGDISVRTQLQYDELLSNYSYPEPIMRMSKDDTTLSWTSEVSASSETRSIRKFVDSVAKVLSHSPEMEGAILNITKLMGFDMPPIPHGFSVGGHRKGRGMHSIYDVKLNLPRWFLSLTEARYIDELSDFVYNLDRGDRTTYLESSRCLAHSFFKLEYNYAKTFKSFTKEYKFSVNSNLWEVMHVTVPMTATVAYSATVPLQVLGENLKNEFESSLYEYRDAMEGRSTLMELSNIAIEAKGTDLQMVMDIYRSAVKRWLINFRQSENTTLIHSFDIPLPSVFINEIMQSSALLASLQTMDPQLRRRLIDRVHNWLTSKSFEEFTQFSPDISKSPPLIAFYNELSEYFSIIESAVPEEYSISLPSIEHGITPEIMIGLAKYVSYNNLLDNPRIVVVRSGQSTYGKITSSHRTAFKEAFTVTLSSLNNICWKLKWDREAIRRELETPIDPDLLMTCLIVCRELLRSSEHRKKDHPYNKHSAIIQMFKVGCYIESYYEMMDREANMSDEETAAVMMDDEMIDALMDNFKIKSIQRDEIVYGLKLEAKDVDHLAMIYEPLPEAVISRLKHEIRDGRKRWVKNRYLRFPPELREIIPTMTFFYDIITKKAVESLKEYSSDLESTILESFSPSTKSIVNMASLSTDAIGLSGEIVDIDRESDLVRSDMISLCQAILKDYLSRNRRSGVVISRDMTQLLSLICAPFRTDNGLTLSIAQEKVNEDSSIYLYFMRYADNNRALSDYIILSSRGDPSVSIIRDQNSGMYYVAGIVDSSVLHSGYDDNPSVNIGSLLDIDSFIPMVTIKTEAAIVRTRSYANTVSNFREKLSFSRIQSMSKRARRVDRSGHVVEDSIMLVSAFNLVNGTLDNKAVVGAYVGVLMWLKGIEDVSKVRLYTLAVKKKFDKSNDRDRFKITNDISLTVNWLVQMNIHPGIDLLHDDLIACTLALKQNSFPVKIAVTATLAKVRSVEEVRISLAGQSNIVGSISSHLYSLESFRMIEDIQETATDIEIREAEELAEDL